MIGSAAGLVVFFAVSGAASADTSLDREVEQYLEANSGAAAEPETFRAFWKHGLHMETGDGAFTLSLGGRIHFDMEWADSDDNLSNGQLGENEVGFKRTWLHASGTAYKNTVYYLQFAIGESISLLDVYVGLKNVGGGKLVFGHLREPFGLNELTSSNFIAFIERAPSSEAFTPQRNAGISWWGHIGESERIYLAGGTFLNTDNTTARVSGNGGWGFTVRVGGLAIENPDRGMALWIAFDVRWSNLRMSDQGSRTVRYRSRADGLGPFAIDTGDIDAEDDLRYAFEIAFHMRSVHAQAEFFWTTPSLTPGQGSDPTFFGFYAQVGWYLTGEARSFDKGSGTWLRTVPKANFWTGEGGSGAIEIVLRWDATDLTDESVDGGELDTLTAGVNWYWNPNARMMVNFVYADIGNEGAANGGGSGELNYVIIRWQIDF